MGNRRVKNVNEQVPDTYSEPCQVSKIKSFAIVNGIQLLTILVKNFILHFCLVPECAFELYRKDL